jgi:hypothetical protein
MTHIHWVARQNKLEIPNDEEETNTREIHKCEGQGHDPDTLCRFGANLQHCLHGVKRLSNRHGFGEIEQTLTYANFFVGPMGAVTSRETTHRSSLSPDRQRDGDF